MEAQDELAWLRLGDQTFRQLVLKVQQFISVAFQGVDETMKDTHEVHAFLQALIPELSRGIAYQILDEVRDEA